MFDNNADARCCLKRLKKIGTENCSGDGFRNFLWNGIYPSYSVKFLLIVEKQISEIIALKLKHSFFRFMAYAKPFQISDMN